MNVQVFSDAEEVAAEAAKLIAGIARESAALHGHFMMAVSGGISPLMAVFISFTNVTSAGQFAGIQLIFQTVVVDYSITGSVFEIPYDVQLILNQCLQ